MIRRLVIPAWIANRLIFFEKKFSGE